VCVYSGQHYTRVENEGTRMTHHDKVFHGSVEELRAPQRVALLELPRVKKLCLDGIRVHSVLDIGTGSGLILERFLTPKQTGVGTDISLPMLHAARALVPDALFCACSAHALPFADGSFDLVMLGHVLHEVEDQTATLHEIRRVARTRVIALEWPYTHEEMGPPLHHRLQPAHVVAAAKDAGFRRVGSAALKHTMLFAFDV